MRNIPDVALTANNIFVEANNGQPEPGVGGTSCAAPLWAGFTALVNQQAAAHRQTVSRVSQSGHLRHWRECQITPLDFHDITNGNNFSASSPTNYPAVPGYDLCTGWGTPNGQNLINALAPPDTLDHCAGKRLCRRRTAGRTVHSQLGNSGPDQLRRQLRSPWSLVNTSAWLNASSTSGTLAAGGTNKITMSLAAAASRPRRGNLCRNGDSHKREHACRAKPCNLICRCCSRWSSRRRPVSSPAGRWAVRLPRIQRIFN